MTKQIFGALALFALAAAGCGGQSDELTLFYAPCFSPVMTALKTPVQEKLGIRLKTEVSGSQVVLRKINDLGRDCDVAMVADAGLFKKMAADQFSWRIEFSHDEMVLGIGIRARKTDEAEKHWADVVQDPQIVMGRVDENLGPIGYRTLLFWKLAESEYPGLYDRMMRKGMKILDHVDHLAAMLKSGDVEYGFLYKTTCRQYDIRSIQLPASMNFGSTDQDYSRAVLTFGNPPVTRTGKPITYALSIPDAARSKHGAERFVRFLLADSRETFLEKGYSFYRPRFFGTSERFKDFEDIADYGGAF